MMGWVGKRPFFISGLLACPLVLTVTLTWDGGSNPNYIAARLLLPFACLAIGKYSAAAWIASILAVSEWPVYGGIVDMASRELWSIGAILVVHIGLTLWLFTGAANTFS